MKNSLAFLYFRYKVTAEEIVTWSIVDWLVLLIAIFLSLASGRSRLVVGNKKPLRFRLVNWIVERMRKFIQKIGFTAGSVNFPRFSFRNFRLRSNETSFNFIRWSKHSCSLSKVCQGKIKLLV